MVVELVVNNYYTHTKCGDASAPPACKVRMMMVKKVLQNTETPVHVEANYKDPTFVICDAFVHKNLF